jgi:phage tail-like protein
MPNSENDRPPISFVFQLSFAEERGFSNFTFQEVSGISMETNIEEVAAGGENRFKYKLPVVNKNNNLVLKRSLLDIGSTLYSWVMKTLNSGLTESIETKNINIALIDHKANIIASWDVINAYPVMWNISKVESMESKVAVESIEFAYKYFKRNRPVSL